MRLVTEGAAWQPADQRASERESKGNERIGEVSLRPRDGTRQLHLCFWPRGESAGFLRDNKGITADDDRYVMVPSVPRPPLEVVESQFTLEIFVHPFCAPALFDNAYVLLVAHAAPGQRTLDVPFVFKKVTFDVTGVLALSAFKPPPLSKIDPFVLGRIDPGWDREVSWCSQCSRKWTRA